MDIGLQESTRLTDEMLAWADLVVTACGHADEHCPVLPGGARALRMPGRLAVSAQRKQGDEAISGQMAPIHEMAAQRPQGSIHLE